MTHQINTSHFSEWKKKSAAPEFRTNFAPRYLGTCTIEGKKKVHVLGQILKVISSTFNMHNILSFTGNQTEKLTCTPECKAGWVSFIPSL